MFSVDELQRQARTLGIECEKTRAGHIKLRRDGRTYSIPSTPGDYRSQKNTLGDLRRIGWTDLANTLDPKPPKKKEPGVGVLELLLAKPGKEQSPPQQQLPPPVGITVPVLPDPVVQETGLRASIEVLNADDARRFLESNVNNRPMKPDHLNKLTHQFLTGDFLPGVGTINISHSGRLLNSQHRLTALIQADRKQPGITWTAVVVRGNEEEALLVIDTGAPRTLGDYLKLERNEKYPTALAGALTSLDRILRKRDTDQGVWSRSTGSNSEMVRFLESHPTLRESVKIVRLSGQKGSLHIPVGPLASVHWMLESMEAGTGDQLVGCLLTGVFSIQQQPLLTLREHMIVLESKGMHSYVTTKIRWLMVAVNAWRMGTEIDRRQLIRPTTRVNLAGFKGYLA